MTNKTDKIKNNYQIHDEESDHDPIVLIRQMKVDQTEEKYINVRNIKEIDKDLINNDILNHSIYMENLTENNSDKQLKT